MAYKVPKSATLRAKLKKSTGYLLTQKINQFYLTTYIFDNNFSELIALIDKQVEPVNALRLQQFENKNELEKLQLETLRLLHNYITSAVSLIDHTRNHTKDLYSNNSQFLEEYQEKVKASFVKSPLAVFIVSLRQYIQHYQTPIISTVSNLTEDLHELNTKIVISKKDLLLFSGWKSLAKDFIEKLEGNLDISSTIHQYHNLVKEFYKWFQSRQMVLHKADFEEMKDISQKMLDAQIEELICDYIRSDNYETVSFIKEICRYMGDIESKAFINASKSSQLEYILSLILKKQINLTKKELTQFKIKYKR